MILFKLIFLIAHKFHFLVPKIRTREKPSLLIQGESFSSFHWGDVPVDMSETVFQNKIMCGGKVNPGLGIQPE